MTNQYGNISNLIGNLEMQITDVIFTHLGPIKFFEFVTRKVLAKLWMGILYIAHRNISGKTTLRIKSYLI